jgi:hypothetical protein
VLASRLQAETEGDGNAPVSATIGARRPTKLIPPMLARFMATGPRFREASAHQVKAIRVNTASANPLPVRHREPRVASLLAY